MIVYCIISSFINAVTSLVLGVAVLLRRPMSTPNAPFFGFALAVSLWSGGYLAWQLAGDAASALFWVRALSAAAILVPPAYYHFASRLVGRTNVPVVIGGYVVGGIFAAFSATPLIAPAVGPRAGFPYWPTAGGLYPAYVAFFGGLTVLTWWKLLVAWRVSSHARRNQLKFVFWGTTIGFIGGASNFPLWFRVPIPPVGNGLVALYVVGVAYAIIRFRLLEVNYVMTKMIAYGLAALPLAVVYPLVAAWLLNWAGDPLRAPAAWFLVSVPLSFAAFLVLPALKRRLNELLDRTLLKPYLSGRDQLRVLAHEMAGMRDETAMFAGVADAVAGALSTGTALYARGELDTRYRLRASRDFAPVDALPESLGDCDPILGAVRGRQRAVLLDELEHIDPAAWPALKEEKARRRIEVAVPVHADGYIYGMMVLGVRGRHRVYSDIELSLLDSLCFQLGLHLRARQLERRANQAEKLISLGTLAAGLAHELRNPLVSIKTFSALLEENIGNPEFHHEFSATVLRDVNRIESIVENVAAFATDRKVAFTWFRLEEVVRAAYEIVRPSFVAAGVRFEFEPGDTPHVRGNHNQLTQVVINLLNNAVQALNGREDSRVRVSLLHRSAGQPKPVMELAVADNGPGIDPEVRDRLFEPFITTKDTGDRSRAGGMGLGLAIVKRIVDGHSGVVRVESTPGRGTTFTVVLPCDPPES